LVSNFDLLSRAWLYASKHDRIRLLAWVVLPDHVHMIVAPTNTNLSNAIRRAKLSFSASLRNRIGVRSGRVWQNRFWDHVIRDQDDLNNHIDYIHRNPVKHGVAGNPREWPLSSFGLFVRRGMYTPIWLGEGAIDQKGEFGE
jgi:putative transposase